MRILLTGATGLVGIPLAKKLAEKGHELVVLSRSREKARDLLALQCEIIAWDPDLGAPPKHAFQGLDAIIHLAGEPVAGKRWSDDQKKRILDSRVKTAKDLLDGMRGAAAPLKVFISASAVGFYGDRGDEVLTESSTPGEGFLSEVCQKWEDVVRANPASYERFVVLRTGIVLSKKGGALEKMLPLFKSALGGPLGSGKQWMSWIELDDLVELYLAALENPAYRGIVNAVSPEPVRNEDFTKALAHALDRPAIFRAPQFALEAALGEMSEIVLHGQRVLPEVAKNQGFKYQHLDLAEALKFVTLDESPGDEEYCSEQWIPKPVGEVFKFFSDAKNLGVLTPPWLNLQVLQQTEGEMRTGTLIDYSLTVHGVPLSWQTRIENWDSGKGFVDTQLKGPYKKWHHTHTFIPLQGGTLMKDRVWYRLPGGPLVNHAGGFFVRRDVNQIFAFRKKKIRELFG